MAEDLKSLKARIAELEEELRIKRLHLDLATDGAWDWAIGGDGTQEIYSDRFWTLLGIDPKTKTSRSSEWQHQIHPDDLTKAMTAYHRHVEDGEPYYVVVRYKHAQGHWIHLICRGVALRDTDGKPYRMLGAHQDVTGLVRVHENLEKLKQAREGRMDSIDDILEDIDRIKEESFRDLQKPEKP